MSDKERVARFEEKKVVLESKGYIAKEHTISILKANVMAFVYAGPIAVLFIMIFNALHKSGSGEFSLGSIFVFLFMNIVLIICHELLHGVGWSLSCKEGMKSIHFGVIWKALTPYCSCAEALTFKQYAIGGLLPFVVLGIGGALLGIITGSYLVMILSAINIIAAGGDITIMLSLLKHRDKKIMDHPTKCGFWSFSKE